MHTKNRWVLLEHRGDPTDSQGIHFDLLLEDGAACRSWRLKEIPIIDGPAIEANPLPVHRLNWLEIKASAVSGGRGWAKRLKSGFFKGSLPRDKAAPIELLLNGNDLEGNLRIHNQICQINSITQDD